MRFPHHLIYRPSGFSFRLIVPTDLRPLIGQGVISRTLQTHDRRLAQTFALVLASQYAQAFKDLPDVSSTRDLEACILRLRNLFRALGSPSAREIAGLWSELFVILKSGNPERALTIWHADQFDRFDFSSEIFCLEVKSTIKSIRAHEFSLEQLQSPMSGLGLVASVMLQPLTGGVSVLDLARSIEAEVAGSPSLKQKLWENVAITLGADFSDRLDRRFDLSYAERGFAMYAMDDVPKPTPSADPRVTAIRFVSDLTSVASDKSFEELTIALSNS